MFGRIYEIRGGGKGGEEEFLSWGWTGPTRRNRKLQPEPGARGSRKGEDVSCGDEKVRGGERGRKAKKDRVKGTITNRRGGGRYQNRQPTGGLTWEVIKLNVLHQGKGNTLRHAPLVRG